MENRRHPASESRTTSDACGCCASPSICLPKMDAKYRGETEAGNPRRHKKTILSGEACYRRQDSAPVFQGAPHD